jgi:deoxycytidylate deaminase
MDCQDIVFSQNQSQKRIEKALRIFPTKLLKNIFFFALYLLGARLNAIASLVEMPEQSGKTTISRVMRDGMPAFRDRRQSAKAYELQPPPQEHQASVLIEGDCCAITFGNMNHRLEIPQSHRVHLRSVLLSLLQANLLSIHTVSSALGITVVHCRELSAKLVNNGVTEVLVDKRKGQKQDFRVDLSVKAELIQHFAARAVTGHSISSQALTDVINDSQKTTISPRTIRWHMSKLGLMKIKKTLPKLVETLKKTLAPAC